ncbi:Uncharacterised protein [Vibrio cholerae]|nr:Uncharacterised protein [Vibrio cholerae]CSI75909.1 Uncharacterised protein [Vibrio cholerae]
MWLSTSKAVLIFFPLEMIRFRLSGLGYGNGE